MTEFKEMLLSALHDTGLEKLFTSMFATGVSFNIHGLGQFITFVIAIVSGCMAIRHYAIATKLNQVKLEKYLQKNGDA